MPIPFNEKQGFFYNYAQPHKEGSADAGCPRDMSNKLLREILIEREQSVSLG